MADKIVTLRPSGGDYSSLSAAIAGELSANPNLVTMDGILTILSDQTWTVSDSTRAVLNGFTTDATRYVRIVDVTGTYRLEAGSTGSSGTLDILDDYTRLEGLHVRDTTGGGYCAIYSNGTTGVQINECVVYNCGWHGIMISDGATNAHVRNCIVYGCAHNGIQSSSNGTATTNYASNCVVTGCGENGIVAGIDSTLNARNCYAGGSTTSDYNVITTGTLNLTTCYSEDGSRSTSTATADDSTFIDYSEHNYTLATGSALIGVGTDLSAAANYPFSVDFNGDTRSSPWDVGAFASSTGPATYAMTYDANGGSGAPTDSSSPYEENATVTVLGAGSMVRPGYTFSTWNTAADGSGTSRAPSSTFSMPAADVTLYAQWTRGSRIVNHENFDACDSANDATITAAAALKVYFEHASTGQDIVGNSDADSSTGQNYDASASCGLAELYAINSRYLCNRESFDSSNDYTWFASNNGLQDNHRGNPTPATKVSGFVGMSANMRGAIDVAMWKYCWIDVWPETSGYISDGAAAAASDIEDIEAFETANPGITVVWWTMPLQTNASYAAREAYNNAIRTYCAGNDKYLIDIADIECHNPTDVKQVDGNSREVMYSSYARTDGGHLASDGRLRMARAYWTALTLISGTVEYTLSGITRDKSGDVLTSCTVSLFKHSGSGVFVYVDTTTSDGSTGAYSFTVEDNDAAYMVYAFRADTPHVFDASDYVLQPEV